MQKSNLLPLSSLKVADPPSLATPHAAAAPNYRLGEILKSITSAIIFLWNDLTRASNFESYRS